MFGRCHMLNRQTLKCHLDNLSQMFVRDVLLRLVLVLVSCHFLGLLQGQPAVSEVVNQGSGSGAGPHNHLVNQSSGSGAGPPDHLVNQGSGSGQPAVGEVVNQGSGSGAGTPDHLVNQWSGSGEPALDEVVDQPESQGLVLLIGLETREMVHRLVPLTVQK